MTDREKLEQIAKYGCDRKNRNECPLYNECTTIENGFHEATGMGYDLADLDEIAEMIARLKLAAMEKNDD